MKSHPTQQLLMKKFEPTETINREGNCVLKANSAIIKNYNVVLNLSLFGQYITIP